jgi:hypothetical protein
MGQGLWAPARDPGQHEHRLPFDALGGGSTIINVYPDLADTPTG